jgi:arsenite/tail-anchored protein-transporting ATPase
MRQSDSLHLAMFSGKGGVGKTTLSCGFARQWARQFSTEKILLLSTDPAHSLGDVLQMTVTNAPSVVPDLPNLAVRALDAGELLQAFKTQYGAVLQLLVERGSFAQKEDLTPVWDLNWPGLDELMGILEIQRLLREHVVDRIVVDMAPSGHTLNLFGLMTFLEEFLGALELFQEKHRVMSHSFTGRHIQDEADTFLRKMKADLLEGRHLLQHEQRTACLVVAIAESMSLLETQRFLKSLRELQIPCGGLYINQLVTDTDNRYRDQQLLVGKFIELGQPQPVMVIPRQLTEPVGLAALDRLIAQVQPATVLAHLPIVPFLPLPTRISPGLPDFVTLGRRLILVGGKGGVGKTTVAAAIGWSMAEQHPEQTIRVISIDPAHSLGDALGFGLDHEPTAITANLSAQEIEAERMLDQFRHDYLWELADMMSGESSTAEMTMQIAYAPEAWRRIVAQALPGIDEMLALIKIVELLESRSQDLIILDTAPTGHLLRFLEMPTALGDWLAWIFKIWIKHQDILGRTELMGRLRTLRQRVMQAQKHLKDPQHTEFIGVIQSQSAIIAEMQRLTTALTELGVTQRYIVNNRFEAEKPRPDRLFGHQTVVHLPLLPGGMEPIGQVQAAAHLLFSSQNPLPSAPTENIKKIGSSLQFVTNHLI